MFLIGVAGGSGSGKTTFAKKIFASETSDKLALLHQDSYYLPAPPQHLKVHGEPNFDHPEAFDWPLIKDHLERLRAGEQVAVPIYDYRISRRTAETTLVGPCKVVIMEGIYALWDPEIRNLFDIRVYLHVESDIRFIRRLHRDVRERGRTLDGIIRQYYDTVRPMHHEFLEATKQYADMIVGEETDIAAEILGARVREVIAATDAARASEDPFS